MGERPGGRTLKGRTLSRRECVSGGGRAEAKFGECAFGI
jgi:hypothetical protein